jgi:hypothetical protein
VASDEAVAPRQVKASHEETGLQFGCREEGRGGEGREVMGKRRMILMSAIREGTTVVWVWNGPQRPMC